MKGRIFSVVGGMFLLTVCSKGDRDTVQAAPPAPQPAVSSDPTPAGRRVHDHGQDQVHRHGASESGDRYE